MFQAFSSMFTHPIFIPQAFSELMNLFCIFFLFFAFYFFICFYVYPSTHLHVMWMHIERIFGFSFNLKKILKRKI
jgi:hypothetical protein